MSKNQKIFDRIEPVLFLVLTLLNLLPVLLVKYFPTVDGPAHLYNARLIAELLHNPSSLINQYFTIENLVPTNLTDHYFFLLTGYFLPGFLSEKLLLLFYLAGLPYAYRYFIRSIKPEGIYLSYFIFPFTYSFMFFYGFFNFHIAIVILLLSLAHLRKFYNHPSVLNSITFLILTIMVCLSHVFVFMILLLYLIIFYHREIILLLSDKPAEMKKSVIKKLSIVAFIIAPSLLLIIISSIRSQPLDLQNDYMSISQHLKWIRQIQPAKGIVYQREDIYTTWLFYLLVLMTIVTIYNIFIAGLSYSKGRISFTINKDKNYKPDNILLVISLVILAIYFILPDGFRGYWFVSSRLLVFFFLFFIAWIASGHMQFWIKVTAIVLIIVMNTFLLRIYIHESKKLNYSACELEKAAEFITPNSTLLPINQSGKWIYGHFSNYLGINKPMVILENYEAELDYFPISWNIKRMPRMLFGEADSLSSCLKWKSQPANAPQTVEYVLLINNLDSNNDSCNSKINEILNKYYTSVFKSENNEIELYGLGLENDRNQ